MALFTCPLVSPLLLPGVPADAYSWNLTLLFTLPFVPNKLLTWYVNQALIYKIQTQEKNCLINIV